MKRSGTTLKGGTASTVQSFFTAYSCYTKRTLHAFLPSVLSVCLLVLPCQIALLCPLSVFYNTPPTPPLPFTPCAGTRSPSTCFPLPHVPPLASLSIQSHVPSHLLSANAVLLLVSISVIFLSPPSPCSAPSSRHVSVSYYQRPSTTSALTPHPSSLLGELCRSRPPHLPMHGGHAG